MIYRYAFVRQHIDASCETGRRTRIEGTREYFLATPSLLGVSSFNLALAWPMADWLHDGARGWRRVGKYTARRGAFDDDRYPFWAMIRRRATRGLTVQR